MTAISPPYSLAERPGHIFVMRREDRPLSFRQRASVAIRYGDTGPARTALAAVSALVGVASLLQPGVYGKFPIYALMLRCLPQWAWGCLFLLAAAGLCWRLVEERLRPGWGLAVNTLTFALYGGTWILRALASRSFAPGDSAELILAALSFWTLRRTKWPPDAPVHA